MQTQGRLVFGLLASLGVVLVVVGLYALTEELLALHDGEAEDPISWIVGATSLLCLGGFSLYAARVRYRGGWRTFVAGPCLFLGVISLAEGFEDYLAGSLEGTVFDVISIALFLAAGIALARSGYKRHLRIGSEGEVSVQREEELERAEYPTILTRYLSTVIDGILIFSAFIATSALLQQESEVITLLRVGLIVALVLVYEPLCTSRFCTVGQQMMGIRIRSFTTGERISLPAAYMRIVVKVLLGIISFFSIPVSKGRRGIHDFAAGSIVIYAKADTH